MDAREEILKKHPCNRVLKGGKEYWSKYTLFKILEEYASPLKERIKELEFDLEIQKKKTLINYQDVTSLQSQLKEAAAKIESLKDDIEIQSYSSGQDLKIAYDTINKLKGIGFTNLVVEEAKEMLQAIVQRHNHQELKSELERLRTQKKETDSKAVRFAEWIGKNCTRMTTATYWVYNGQNYYSEKELFEIFESENK